MTVVGTAHEEWSYTAAPVPDGACQRTETSEGIRDVKFRTKKPVLVRLSGGRVLPVVVGGITGTVTLGGANTTERICGTSGTQQTADCAQTKRSFAGATLNAASPRPGVLALKHIAKVDLATADCPREPADVIMRPLGPPPKLLRLPKAALKERRVARLTVGATRTQRKAYGAPESGYLDERSQWNLRFDRVAH
ncbi:MAG: hypothetical protein E6G33_06620 [Actinobacteria bacterium]|nr:MAG: hypothetical protein E6G33_06620 [Actinomycetota bacterium]